MVANFSTTSYCWTLLGLLVMLFCLPGQKP